MTIGMIQSVTGMQRAEGQLNQAAQAIATPQGDSVDLSAQAAGGLSILPYPFVLLATSVTLCGRTARGSLMRLHGSGRASWNSLPPMRPRTWSIAAPMPWRSGISCRKRLQN